MIQHGGIPKYSMTQIMFFHPSRCRWFFPCGPPNYKNVLVVCQASAEFDAEAKRILRRLDRREPVFARLF